MKHTVIKAIVVLCVICIAAILFFGRNDTPDYDALYEKFCQNDLPEYLEKNGIQLGNAPMREKYVIDLRNTGKKQLVLVYGEHTAETVVVDYSHGEFVPAAPVDLYINLASGGSESHRIMSKNDKTCYYDYRSSRLEYGPNSRWAIEARVWTYEKGKKVILDELISENGLDYFRNGEKVSAEAAFAHDLTEGYEILVDSRDFW